MTNALTEDSSRAGIDKNAKVVIAPKAPPRRMTATAVLPDHGGGTPGACMRKMSTRWPRNRRIPNSMTEPIIRQTSSATINGRIHCWT